MKAEWKFHARMAAFAIVLGLVMALFVVPRLLERKREQRPAVTTTTILWDRIESRRPGYW